MLEITSKSCYKYDLETIIDSDSEYFWSNLRDFEFETESKWLKGTLMQISKSPYMFVFTQK